MDPNTPLNNQSQDSIPPAMGGIPGLVQPGSASDASPSSIVEQTAIRPINTTQNQSSNTATLVNRPRINPNSTQNSLLINEIRDGIVIMNDGSFRSVVMVKAINYDLMSPEERESVEFAYQGFLNSLYFPIQIFVHSQKVDISPYIGKLAKIRGEHDNMLLAMLMDDYVDFIADLATQANIMDKKFYLVIPYFPVANTQKAVKASQNFLTGMLGKKDQAITVSEADLQTAIQELRNRVQSVLSGLEQCGVQGLPLDTQELIELYYDAYNPDTATRQPLKNFDDLSAEVVEKGEGMAPQPNLNRGLEN